MRSDHYINYSNTIAKPYLVQTWWFSNLGSRFHERFKPDYMGSAEFEFGSIPACFDFIKEHFADYDKIYSNGRFFWIGPEKEGIEKYGNYIDEMASRKLRLKEYVFTNARNKNGSYIPNTSVMRSPLGMDIENCVLFSGNKSIIEAAQESIQYVIDHPLNVKIVRKVNGNTYDYYYCEDVVNNEFLKKEFEGETISIFKLIDGEWAHQEDVVVDAIEKDLKVVIDKHNGEQEEHYGTMDDVKYCKERAVAIRNSFKRFQMFELKDGNWVQFYDWKR